MLRCNFCRADSSLLTFIEKIITDRQSFNTTNNTSGQAMTEREWVKSIVPDIHVGLQKSDKKLFVSDAKRLPYASEILTYKSDKPDKQHFTSYETDILVYEQLDTDIWKPRVIIETKLDSVTTHDSITYSQKAQTHKNVHPYLRYGILIGNREDNPLPGRLFRHGQHFDFMVSWRTLKPDKTELKTLIDIVLDEVKSSRTLDEIIFNSRSKSRDKFTSLHRPLLLTQSEFSKWVKWTERDKLDGIKSPGIYCIAISENDLSNTVFDWNEKINYIGMTNAVSGLKGRLKQFDNTIQGKTGHGGADRFRYEYRNYEDLKRKLFVSVKYFECNVKSNLPNDLLVMGEVAKHEFVCFAEFVSRHRRLPKFNDKPNTKKYSLTVGRKKD